MISGAVNCQAGFILKRMLILLVLAFISVSFICMTAAKAEDESDLSLAPKDRLNKPVTATAKQKTALDILNAEFKKYGRFTCAGMTVENYSKAAALEWSKVEVEKIQKDVTVDLNALYSYADIENIMKDLASNDGVELDIIGKTAGNLNIYSIKIDVNPSENKKIVLYTGGVHAREGAGAVIILRQFCDLVQKAKTDPAVMELLGKVTFIAIPLVNPEGREMIIGGGNKNRKSNENGVDLNRNFPAFNASQLVKGVRISNLISKKPSLYYFSGYSLGSENETQAAMKWLDTYIPKASVYIDYHQKGRQVYGGKPWDTKARENDYKAFAYGLLGLINNGIPKGKYVYQPEIKNYGLNGAGGTITDYAVSVAAGMRFSEKFGRMVLNAGGRELPLLLAKDLDKYSGFVTPANRSIRIATYEICTGSNSVGYGAAACAAIAQEYSKYHFDMIPIYNAQYAAAN